MDYPVGLTDGSCAVIIFSSNSIKFIVLVSTCALQQLDTYSNTPKPNMNKQAQTHSLLCFILLLIRFHLQSLIHCHHLATWQLVLVIVTRCNNLNITGGVCHVFPIVVYLCLPSSTDCKDPVEIKVIQYRAGCSVAAHMMEHTHLS